MVRSRFLLWMLLAMLLFGASIAFAGNDAAPHAINFNGYLTSTSGSQESGTFDMRFILFVNKPIANTPIWAAEYTSVTVTNGQFSVVLGTAAQGGVGIVPATWNNALPTINAADLPISSALLTGIDSTYSVTLELEVLDGVTWDALSPQFAISSSLFALQSEVAETANGIQGTPVNPIAPTINQVLQFDGTQWTATTFSAFDTSGATATNIGNGTNTGAVNMGNPTGGIALEGPVTMAGQSLIQSGNASATLGTGNGTVSLGSGTGAVSIGNSTGGIALQGPVTMAGESLTQSGNSSATIGTGSGTVTIGSGTGTVTIGNTTGGTELIPNVSIGSAPVAGIALNVASIAETGANAYGLAVNAPTGGATANYAAEFLGGSVGIGTATPGAPLHIKNGTSGWTQPWAATDSLILENGNAAGTGFTLMSAPTGTSMINFGVGVACCGNWEYKGQISFNNTNDSWAFSTGLDFGNWMTVGTGGLVTVGSTSYPFFNPDNGPAQFMIPTGTHRDNSHGNGNPTTAALVRFSDFQASTINAQYAGITTTNADTVYIQGAVKPGTNETLTNSSALYVDSSAVTGVGTTTNSYGMFVNAQTGATNNYAASFMGGNVGIGVTSPQGPLDVRVNSSLTGAIGAGATSFTVSDSTGFNDSGAVVIDGETITYSAISTNTFTCTATVNNHAAGATVYGGLSGFSLDGLKMGANGAITSSGTMGMETNLRNDQSTSVLITVGYQDNATTFPHTTLGLEGLALSTTAGGQTVNQVEGVEGYAGVESAHTGTVTTAYGVHAKTQSGTGTVTNGYGLYVENVGGGGGFGTSYGVYINSLVGTTTWGVYEAGANNNYLAGNLRIGTAATPTHLLELSADSAAKPGTNTWTIASDARLKDIRAPFTRGLGALNGIHPIYFRYKKDNPLDLPSDKEYVGIRAQDVQKVVPEAIQTDEKGYLHFTSDAVIYTMLNAVKELYAKLIHTNAKVADQDKRLRALETSAGRAPASDRIEKLEHENAQLKKDNAQIKAWACSQTPRPAFCE